MRYLARTEYDLLVSTQKEAGISLTAELIEQVSYSSKNPLFRSREFRVALLDFKVNGFKKFELNKTSEELRLIKLHLQERGLV